MFALNRPSHQLLFGALTLCVSWCGLEAIAAACTVGPPPPPPCGGYQYQVDDEGDDDCPTSGSGASGPTGPGPTGPGPTGPGSGGSGGSGGGGECYIQQTCAFAIPKIYPLPQQPASVAAAYSAPLIGLDAMIYLSEYRPGCNDNCPTPDKLTLEFSALCTALVENPEHPAFGKKVRKTYIDDNPQFGRNDFPIEFLLDFVDMTQVTLGNAPVFQANGGKCIVYGEAILELTDGTVLRSDCGERPISFAARSPMVDNAPIIEFEIDAAASANGWDPPAGWSADNHGGTSVAGPGQQQRRVLRIKNNANSPMSVSLTVTTQNINDSATVEPSGNGLTVQSWDLSAGGGGKVPRGDAFPVIVRPLTAIDANVCIELPDVPGDSDEQSDSLSDTPISIAPGDEFFVELVRRGWPQCASGTCEAWTGKLEAIWIGGSVSADISGSDIIDRSTPATNCSDDDPVNHPSPYFCDGEGDIPPGAPCGEEGQLVCENGNGDTGSARGIGGLEHPPGARPGEEKFPSRRPTGKHDKWVGAYFNIDADTKLHLTKLTSKYGVPIDASWSTAHRFSPEVMRMVEVLRPTKPLADGEKLNVKVPILVLQQIGKEVKVLKKVAVGEKQMPKGALPHSFVYLIRSQLDTKPAIQVEVMLQVTTFARDLATGSLEPVTMDGASIALMDGGIDLDFNMQKPAFETDLYEVVYDVRSYRWNDYEQDCEDKTDNDGDGFADCDDPDCASHPLCDDGGTGGGSGSGSTNNTNVDSGEGCSCGIVGLDPGRSALAMFALGGLALLGSSRRRRRRRWSRDAR